MRLKSLCPTVKPAIGLFFTLLLAGCTTLSVESNPPGARVLWSPDGVEPFRSCPPNSWQLDENRTGKTTPFRAFGRYGDAVFITVEKEGYHQPLPQLAQLYSFRRESLRFDLQELPETRAARLTSEGFVQYQGEWVKPEEQGLKQYEGVWYPAEEAERLKMQARGLVLYEGEWLAPEVAEARLAAAMQSRGYVHYKEQWLPPAAAEGQRRIDDRVAAFRAAKDFADLPSPKVLGKTRHEEAQLELYNTSGREVEILFSGPASRSWTIPPFEGIGTKEIDRIAIPPGRYDIVIMPAGAEEPADAQWGNWPFNAGMEYSLSHGAGQASQTGAGEPALLP